jgi:hypothetical protein
LAFDVQFVSFQFVRFCRFLTIDPIFVAWILHHQ